MQVVNVGGVQYLVTPQGLIPLQVALQLAQQQSSLQQAPQSASDGFFGGLQKGATSAFEKKGKDYLFGGDDSATRESKQDIIDKLGEALGLSEPAAQTLPNSTIFSSSGSPMLGVDAAGASTSFSGGGVAGGEAVGSALDGGTLMSTGEVVPATAGEAIGSGNLAAGAEAAPGMFSMQGIGSAGNAILPAAGAYGAYNLIKSQGDAPSGGRRNIRGFGQGAASGAAIGSYFGPPGAIIGGIIGGTAGLAGSLFGSSKGERQMTRDDWRKQQLGKLFDDNYQGTLADNTTFDFGKDKFGFGTKGGDIDLSKPAVSRAAAWGNALAGLTGYGGGKGKEAVSTQFTAASTANLKDPNDINTVKNNYKHFLNKLGITTKEQAQRALDQMSASNNASQQEWAMGHDAINELFSDKPPSGFDKNGKWVG